MDSLQPLIDFVMEIDRLKAVTRRTKPVALDRYENAAEHSWQIALMAMAMAPHAGPDVDVAQVVAMLLVHDLGEIDTGDTLVYVEHGWDERKARERACLQRLSGRLQPAQGDRLMALWEEFEAAETPSARYAHALDRAMPVLLNLHREGQSWRENGVSHAQVVRRIGPPIAAGCPSLWAWLEPRLADARARGWFGAPD